MINNDLLIKEFANLVTHFYNFVGQMNKLNMLDSVVASEMWVAEVCSIIWEADFQRSSIFKANADSFDLEAANMAIQVTSNRTSEKIIETIKTFTKGEHYTARPKLYFFVLADRPDYTSKKLDETLSGLPFLFNRNEQIIGKQELISLASNLKIDRLEKLVAVSRRYFAAENSSVDRQRNELEQKVLGYKKDLRPMRDRIAELRGKADKYSRCKYNHESCESVVGGLKRSESALARTNESFSTILRLIVSASNWKLRSLGQASIEIYVKVFDADVQLEILTRGMERQWELGCLIEKLEKNEETIAVAEAEREKMEEEMREIQGQMDSLEFAIKWFEPAGKYCEERQMVE